MKHALEVSIVLATHNRRNVVLHTLSRLADCGLRSGEYEIIVVDNASADGTADELRGHPEVRVVQLEENLGSCAKSAGVEHARGRLVLFLDDDSFPRPGCLARMLTHFAEQPRLGAAGFTVHLPDGSQECSALPHVFVGCGAGLRAEALREVGGLDQSFFMQAEEYDLSFRLLQAGWRVEIFADLQVDHLKSPTARRSERTTFYDIRNNLRLIARYLPDPQADIYQADWTQRYRWLAQRAGHQTAFERGLAEGRHLAAAERPAFESRRLCPPILEQLFCWSLIEERMLRLREDGVRRIVLADLGKNVYPFYRGAATAGLDVLALADDRLAVPGRDYRGVPLLSTSEALSAPADAIVVSNTSYVHAQRRAQELRRQSDLPVHAWFMAPGQFAASPHPAAMHA